MDNLIKSREFWSMVFAFVVSVIISLVPQLEAVREEMITLLFAIAGLFITFAGAEKVIAAHSSGSTKIERMAKK